MIPFTADYKNEFVGGNDCATEKPNGHVFCYVGNLERFNIRRAGNIVKAFQESIQIVKIKSCQGWPLKLQTSGTTVTSTPQKMHANLRINWVTFFKPVITIDIEAKILLYFQTLEIRD